MIGAGGGLLAGGRGRWPLRCAPGPQLGRDESSQVIGLMTGSLADLAESTAAQAAAVLRNGRRGPS
jgi:hypothetical protein